jgi:hypothetical protein
MDYQFLKPFKVAKKIRVGRPWDGGYVLEDASLDKIDVIYSYGVGWEVSFEKALYNRTKKIIRIFDPTMFDTSNLGYYQRRGAYHFFKYLAKVVYFKTYLLSLPLGGFQIKFYNEGLATKHYGKYDSFPNHVKRFGDEGKKIMLKIDIEGGEFEVFKDDGFIRSLDNVVQLALEIHDLQENMNALREFIVRIAPKFSVVHTHANNYGGVYTDNNKKVPRVLELTLLNNAYMNGREADNSAYPQDKLDYPNDRSKPDISLEGLFS